jgi:hypothetical protein
MVATSLGAVPFSLTCHTAAEFATPEDERLVEQTALFEIGYKCGTGPIGVPAAGHTPGTQPSVVIPVGVK